MSIFHKDRPAGDDKSPQVQEWEKNLADAKAREGQTAEQAAQEAAPAERVIGQNRMGADRLSAGVDLSAPAQPGYAGTDDVTEIEVRTGPNGEIVETKESDASIANRRKGKK